MISAPALGNDHRAAAVWPQTIVAIGTLGEPPTEARQ
jgi:hypothetical protein